MTGATNEAGTAYPSRAPAPVFSGVRVTLSLVLCGCFFRFLFVHLSFFFWPLCCLSFNLRIRIIALVSSNFRQTDEQTKHRLYVCPEVFEEHNYRTALLLVFFHFLPLQNTLQS